MRLYQKLLQRFFPSLASQPLPPPVCVSLGTVSDYPDGQGKPIVAAGRKVAVFRQGEEIYVLHNSCPHNRVPLSSGIVAENIVVCRAHGARFDLKTGAVLRGPARKAVRTYPVFCAGETLEVEIS